MMAMISTSFLHFVRSMFVSSTNLLVHTVACCVIRCADLHTCMTHTDKNCPN